MQDSQILDGNLENQDTLYPENQEVNNLVFPDQGNNFPPAENNDNVINVDNDFGGDLKTAIAAAQSGDLVELGDKTYFASGIVIDKDITLDGGAQTVIDGGNASDAVLTITQDATGATIQDLQITNANNGIVGHGASNLTLQNLNLNNIGINQPIREGNNNTGISLSDTDGVQVLNSNLNNIGRKGIGIGDSVGVKVEGVTVQNVNLAAQHAQNHDAGGVKFFNTADVTVQNSNFRNINANFIWNDTTTGTTISNNNLENVGTDYLAPSFNSEVGLINGIYNEKSTNSNVSNNNVSVVSDVFLAFNATEFTTESMTLIGNNFSTQKVGTTDYYVNEEAEKLVAQTVEPDAAGFDLYAADYNNQAII